MPDLNLYRWWGTEEGRRGDGGEWHLLLPKGQTIPLLTLTSFVLLSLSNASQPLCQHTLYCMHCMHCIADIEMSIEGCMFLRMHSALEKTSSIIFSFRKKTAFQRCGKIYHNLLSDNKLSLALVHDSKKKALWQTLLWPSFTTWNPLLQMNWTRNRERRSPQIPWKSGGSLDKK